MKNIFSFYLMILLVPLVASADMSSTNYHIYADSINTGGTLSTGGLYSIADTVGEPSAVGSSTGGSYQINSGFQYMEKGYITMTLSSSTLNLPSVRAGGSTQASTTVSVDTDSATGYSLSISSVSGSILFDVLDGEVSSGSDEYGVNVSGIDSILSQDAAVTADLVLASTSTPITSIRTTELLFKAASSASSAGTSYSQTITLSASANF